MTNIGNKLRKLRQQHNLLQKDVANFLGISESAYGYYEQGRNKPPLDSIKKLAKMYNVSVSYILEETEIPPDILELIETAKQLSPEERKHLNLFLQHTLKRGSIGKKEE